MVKKPIQFVGQKDGRTVSNQRKICKLGLRGFWTDSTWNANTSANYVKNFNIGLGLFYGIQVIPDGKDTVKTLRVSYFIQV